MNTLPTVEMRWERERLIVTATGDTDPTWFLALVGRIADAAASAPTRSVLVDIGGMRATLADIDRYNLGLQVARRWREIPYAMVAAAGMVDPRRFGELVARNRGVNGRVFIHMAEAVEWLESQHPLPALEAPWTAEP